MSWQHPGGNEPEPLEPSRQAPYGTASGAPYGQPYPAAHPAPGFGAGVPPGLQYASWGARVGAQLLHQLLLLAAMLPAGLVLLVGAIATQPQVTASESEQFATASRSQLPVPIIALTVVLFLAALGFGVWNCWRAGSRGQSLGKQWVGIHLVSHTTLRPPGGWISIAKATIRGVIGTFCGLYPLATLLWPLWDERKQTLEDKMLSTLVVRFPGNRLP